MQIVTIDTPCCKFIDLDRLVLAMKYLNLAICILMLLFIGVQYNDPDGPLWMAIYSVPAIWGALAFFKPGLLQTAVAIRLLRLSILLAVAGVIHFWPTDSHWWSAEVWYETETAREGMGIMIVTAFLIVTWMTTRRFGAR